MITSVLPAVRDESRDDLITGWALAARGGDSDAFDLFVRALHPDVRRHVRFLGADHQGAEDLTQDTFVLTKGPGSRYMRQRASATAPPEPCGHASPAP
ncbi:hypothetical protein OHS59_01800 [Streptomyces sp. NBC_00414]|uniref:RNA polymerase sigma factor n=1 Tax=Streptomyces sp. NBC_00414 TaxID=2975739 RepID=UPI002E1DACD8